MSLAERLARQIAAGGPISIAAYMQACLHDPQDGYYATRPRLGADGDFITAPQVSQMFGELIGLWAADIWRQLGAPKRVRLIELGPGDGSLLADALRAGSLVEGFLCACEIWLVEASEPLRSRQVAALADHSGPVAWIGGLEELAGEGPPAILIGNEFLDCLPVCQWVATPAGLVERRVGLDADSRLAFVLSPPVVPNPAKMDVHDLADGDVIESSAETARLGASVGAFVATCGGAALFIDYARSGEARGDTLQAVRGHVKEDPLAHPGLADLTCRPDFDEFLRQARDAGALTSPVVRQSEFLRRLGVETRAAALARAHPQRAATLARQVDRLIGEDQMGSLFQAVCIHSPGFAPTGF